MGYCHPPLAVTVWVSAVDCLTGLCRILGGVAFHSSASDSSNTMELLATHADYN